MTSGELRHASLRPVHTRTPVVVEVATPDGPVLVELTGYRYEPEYKPGEPGGEADGDGKPKQVLVRERLVLTGRVME